MTLRIQNLSLRYGRHRILQDLSLDPLHGGQMVAVLGPNGSGKTTFLKALAGQAPVTRSTHTHAWFDAPADVAVTSPASQGVAPDAGHRGGAHLAMPEPGGAGSHIVDLWRLNHDMRARYVAYLPQSLPPAVPLRVLESLLVADWQRGQRAGRQASFLAAQAVLERLGILDLAMRPLDTLSGGQRQLVGIGQLLVREAPILLLDEPLSALDLRHQAQVLQVLAQETQARACVTLIVLHDLNVALQHARHCVLLQDGRLVAQGAPESVITPETLVRVWGVQGRVERCSRGIPRVLVDGPLPDL